MLTTTHPIALAALRHKVWFPLLSKRVGFYVVLMGFLIFRGWY
jgi:hypothetical protein